MKKTLTKCVLIAASLLPLHALATPITVGGLEWQQPDLLTGFSWDELAAVCQTDTGQCSGTLAATDLTGWRWASVADVADLFGSFDGHPGNRGNHRETNSSWAPQLVSLFTPTLEAPGADVVFGWTRSSDRFSGYYSVYALDRRSLDSLDETRVRRLTDSSVSSPIIGAWLYRGASVSAVPEPTALALMALGLAGLVTVRRRPAGSLARRL